MATEDRTTPDSATETEEEREARAEHRADRPPTDAEVKDADRVADAADEGVSAAMRESARTGANVKGEGQIE